MDLLSEGGLLSLSDYFFLVLSCLLKIFLGCLFSENLSSYSSFLSNLILDVLVPPEN